MATSATLTTTYLSTFRTILDEWNQNRLKISPTKGFRVPLVELKQSPPSKDALKDVIVAFRTRPSLPNEAADKFHADPDAKDAPVDEDGQLPAVEFCSGITVTSAEPGVFVAHVPGMKWSGPTLTHKPYEADLAFGPDIDNEEVYQRTVVTNDILSLALSGGVGCILAYGQTGSGKTYTMESVEHRIARDLFDQARVVGKRLLLAQGGDVPAGAESGDIFEFNVTFLELLGKHASDLLESTEEVDAQGNPVRTEIAVREDKVGNVRPNLISSTLRTSAELEELINKALSHRRTSATLRNATSSRSHAMLTISIKNTLLPYADEGQLILVDLAGSERYEDSKDHDKQRMEEARDNNKSLMNLKECVRAKAKMAAEDGFVHIPWRSNKLTMLLKPIFDIESRQPSKALIIAHVSPHIQDSVHSTNTLSYAAPFKTVPPKPRGPAPYDAEDPRTWDHAKTVEWLTTQFTKRALKTRQVDWNVKAKAAKLAGKTLKPLEAPAPGQLDLGVDILKICPEGYTAKNLGTLYTPQFVQRCLEARSGEALTMDTLKNAAVDMIGNLFYLIITAKSRKRNEIMKSRKKIAVEAYGEAPPRTTTEYDEEEFLEAQIFYGTDWQKIIIAAHKKYKEEGGDWWNEGYPKTTDAMMDKFRVHKAAVEAEKAAAAEEADE
ncbi:P-loop containing nucleoside triphosphate hydrolase protein [Mycena albidolilacea]|uniref:Kinesin-like protein n=1 Tax=Mycena albidolilacea TaxID=1033008 RepID=A0AAD7EVR1_9AGAR|nr:P-loop containing nucleoside triphosphate hydrolase protein [Mycena albidolilacea]